MMAIQSPEEFLALLEKSNLLGADQFLAACQSVNGLDDATLAARHLVRDGFVTRWQAAQLLAGRSSFLLGKYRLLDLLGRGGMGRVFLGRHMTMQRQVALKIISREIAGNPAALERFLAEARAIAALDHPAIVQAYSVDCEGDRYYIVMEYVDGRDLQRVVEEDGSLPWQTAAEYVRQAADGLAHAHGRNLVHCDIKPSNLLVNSQGQVKILDMGMARLGDRNEDADGADVNNGNHLLGSVDYLAPEQALGSDTFDHRADIYSLGCTLYFLLTGHPPFPGGTLPERLLKHQTQQPRPIPTERPDVPPPLVQICRRMMAKQPGERFQSANEIATALAEVPSLVSAAGDAAARPAPAGPRAAGERSPADAAMVAASMPADPGDVLRHWLASTPGRLVLAGGACLLFAVVVAVSMAIMAAREPT
ncbi:MAG: serine/threonine-protein kinase, partial [Patescibacteria group bacterium]|nr:serine/threonine-protein kinase [Patescibacteria group bacterium]